MAIHEMSHTFDAPALACYESLLGLRRDHFSARSAHGEVPTVLASVWGCPRLEISCTPVTDDSTLVRLVYDTALVHWAKRQSLTSVRRKLLDKIMVDLLDDLAKSLGVAGPTAVRETTQFPCLIPDHPLTTWESVAVGMGTGGAFRGTFRGAVASFEDGELLIRATTDPLAGGDEVVMARLSVGRITEVRTSAIPVPGQVRAAVGRALLLSAGFAFLMAIILAARASSDRPGWMESHLGELAAVSLASGLAMGSVVSLLPGLASVNRGMQMHFIASDGRAMALVVKPEQEEAALAVLSGHGLHVIPGPHQGRGD